MWLQFVASVNRVFNSSMEVGVSVCAENYVLLNKRHTNSAYLTFCRINSGWKNQQKSDDIVPESADEKRRYNEALVRRQERLKNRK